MAVMTLRARGSREARGARSGADAVDRLDILVRHGFVGSGSPRVGGEARILARQAFVCITFGRSRRPIHGFPNRLQGFVLN
jgi:hypothetical protein